MTSTSTHPESSQLGKPLLPISYFRSAQMTKDVFAAYSSGITQAVECPHCGGNIASKRPHGFDHYTLGVVGRLHETNDPLGSEQEASIRQEIKRMDAAVRSCDSEISLLRARIQGIMSERKRLLHTRPNYDFVLHPIRRMPRELLLEIFHLCVQNEVETLLDMSPNDGRLFPGTLDTRRAPWTLAQVCRTWRSLALKDKKLWRNFVVTWGGSEMTRYQTSPNPLASLLSLQMLRCRRAGMHVTYLGDSHEAKDVLLQSLCAMGHNWSTASIRGDAAGLRQFNNYRGRFTNLENLDLHFNVDFDWGDDPNTLFTPFSEAPELRKLSLSGDLDAIRANADQFPWKQIEHFTHKVSADYLAFQSGRFLLIPKMKNLRICELDCVPPDGIASPRQNLHLEALHTLTLRKIPGSIESGPEQYLQWFRLPALVVLHFPSGFGCPSTLKAFLDRSECELQELTLIEHELDEREIEDLLRERRLQKLRTLNLGGYLTMFRQYMSEGVFSALTIIPNGIEGGNIVLPRLQRFTLHGYNRKQLSAALVDMIESRWSNPDIAQLPPGMRVDRLEHVELWNPFPDGSPRLQNYDPKAEALLRELCRQGLVVVCVE
ncbi:hypothetical protein Moror_11645 [Moniliophthora roreri MCA 2997]|uniref:Uncharacterized protein n=1 Tax=Moniliophthora roreri (strain MCA 2997) TaxID=1381753 RepID=V2X4P3_MONRO|nr:hypothetical protein Moror_11645 [Moniliophthora roreri MCA 2997]